MVVAVEQPVIDVLVQGPASSHFDRSEVQLQVLDDGHQVAAGGPISEGTISGAEGLALSLDSSGRGTIRQTFTLWTCTGAAFVPQPHQLYDVAASFLALNSVDIPRGRLQMAAEIVLRR